MRNVVVAGALLITAGIAGSQTTAQEGREPRASRHAAVHAAKATLEDARGQTVGQVTLRETPAGVLIRAELTGIPAGTHGFHFHETGTCDAPSFESAGGHFNPDGKTHGFLAEGGPHAGDMPNVHVPEQGRLSLEILNSRMTLAPGSTSLLGGDGTAVVIHSDADDYQTDPAGEAGDRIACGVIERQGGDQ
jgi:superoxide dismutase, Cu-Zn family